MAALDTVGQYVKESRRLLQDEDVPYRYPDGDFIDALNFALLEARRLRADLLLPAFVIPWFDPGKTTTPDLAVLVPFEPMYRPALVFYICGRIQVRDEEPTTDSRASAFMTKFTAQMLSIEA
jgi:hypothetical protein